MTQLQYIKELASKFRTALEEAHNNRDFYNYPLREFPLGCCDDTSILFATYLKEQNIQVSIARGCYNCDDWDRKYTHAWIVLDNNFIIDLTGDQFQYNPDLLCFDIPCYVGEPSEMHNLFLQYRYDYRKFCGMENLPIYLAKLYDIVKRYL